MALIEAPTAMPIVVTLLLEAGGFEGVDWGDWVDGIEGDGVEVIIFEVGVDDLMPSKLEKNAGCGCGCGFVFISVILPF